MNMMQLQKSVALMREFQNHLAIYESELQELWSLKSYSGTEWMTGHYDDRSAKELGSQIIQRLGPLRDNIGRNIDEVTAILDHYQVPTVWKVYPPPAIGGLIRTYNAFAAFIDLETDKEARPTLLQIEDLVSNGIWRAEKEIDELLQHPASAFRRLSNIPRWIGGGLSWFFPTEKQVG
jgi:hypothetical protein